MNYNQILNSMESKENFLKGLIRLAMLDGTVSDEEKNYFLLSAKGFGLSDESILELNKYFTGTEKINISFETKPEKLFFIREGIQICAVDGRYDEKEREEIRILSNELNISNEEVTKLENWVTEGLEWQERGNKLIYL